MSAINNNTFNNTQFTPAFNSQEPERSAQTSIISSPTQQFTIFTHTSSHTLDTSATANMHIFEHTSATTPAAPLDSTVRQETFEIESAPGCLPQYYKTSASGGMRTKMRIKPMWSIGTHQQEIFLKKRSDIPEVFCEWEAETCKAKSHAAGICLASVPVEAAGGSEGAGGPGGAAIKGGAAGPYPPYRAYYQYYAFGLENVSSPQVQSSQQQPQPQVQQQQQQQQQDQHSPHHPLPRHRSLRLQGLLQPDLRDRLPDPPLRRHCSPSER